jgi:iron complex outermembrane recepter protein
LISSVPIISRSRSDKGLTYTQSATGTCPNSPTPGFQNIRGQQAVGAPKWKYRLGANYENPLPGTRFRLYGGINWIWTDSIQYQLGDDPLTPEPSHGMFNAQLGLKAPDDHWEIELFGKNLTNRFYYSNRIGNVLIIGEPIAFVPRDFHIYGGAQLTYRF